MPPSQHVFGIHGVMARRFSTQRRRHGKHPSLVLGSKSTLRVSSLGLASGWMQYMTTTSGMPCGRDRGGARPYTSSVFFSDEKGTSEENVYFKREDEALLKKMLSQHPELNPKYVGEGRLVEGSIQDVNTSVPLELARDIHIVCEKHGIRHVPRMLIQDLCGVFQVHGWKQPKTIG